MNHLILLILLLLNLPGCSKNPMGDKGQIDVGHTPFLEVEPATINNLPGIVDNLFSVIQDENLTDFITANDLDNDQLEFSITIQPMNGIISLDLLTGEFTYTPDSGFSGIDFFSVSVFDGKSYSSPKTFFINVLDKTLISGSLIISSAQPTRVHLNFSQLQVDDSADLNICLSEDTNENEIIEENEYCNIVGSDISLSQSGNSTIWNDLILESGQNGLTFSLDPCDDKKVYAIAEVIGQNNTQVVTSGLYRKTGWTPACLNGEGLKLWLNAQESSSITTNYINTPVNASGMIGSNTLTTSTNPLPHVLVNSHIKVGNDEFMVSAVNATTITVAPDISQTITNQTVRILTVNEWQDQSNSNLNAVQNNVAFQPYYTAKGINNLPSILSNGDRRGLSVSGLTYNEFSIFMLTHEVSVNADVRSYVAKRAAVGADQFIFAFQTNGKRITWDQAGSVNRLDTGFLPLSNTSYIYNWTRKSGAERAQFVDGVLRYSTLNNVNSVNSSRLDIGHENNAALRALSGYIGEVIILDQFVSPAIRVKIEGYLAWKWNLQENLPTDHPYKNQNI